MFEDPETLSRGLDEEAKQRVLFRLDFILKALQTRKEVMWNGNLASLEPEIIHLNDLLQDLTDCLKEIVLLTSNQKEQGLISPPQGPAGSADSPTG